MAIGENLNGFRKGIIWIMMISLMLVCFGAAAETAEPETQIMEIVVDSVSEDGNPDTLVEKLTNDQLAAGYINQVASPGRRTLRGVKPAGDLLTGMPKKIYNFLKPEVIKIAAGQRNNTIFRIPVDATFSDEEKEFTAADLGIATLIDENGYATTQANTAFGNAVLEIVRKAMNALMNDCPYELYWFNKTKTGGYGIEYMRYLPDAENNFYMLAGDLTIKMSVSQDYEKRTYSEDGTSYTVTAYEVDGDLYGSKVTLAIENAQRIINENEGKSNYERLKAYKEEICSLTEYNHEAADDENNIAYGNPWQMIWVFDNDPATTVVCEGYSKAFQYLNDHSKGSAKVISVTGTMNGGNHMWNIATMEDGNNYLVDITNCDGEEGADTVTIGYPDMLFLAGTTSGSVSDGYTFEVRRTAEYKYDDDLTFSDADLTIAPAGYTELEYDLDIDKSSVVTFEEAYIVGYAKGASSVELHIWDGLDADWYQQYTNDGTTISRTYKWGYAGEKNIELIAHYADKEDLIISEPIYVTADGDLEKASITVPATVAVGQDLTGSFVAPGADSVYISLEKIGEGNVGDGLEVVLSEDDKTGTFTFADTDYGFIPGEAYRVHVEAFGYGKYSSENTAYVIFVGTEVDDTKEVSLTVNGSAKDPTIAFGEWVDVAVNAPGATAVAVWNGNDWDFWWEQDDDFVRNWRFHEDTRLVAMASYDKVDFNSVDWSTWNWGQDMTWTGLSNSVMLYVDEPGGQLAAPHFTIDSKTPAWGDYLTVRVTDEEITDIAGNHAEGDVWYYLRVEYQEPGEDGEPEWRKFEYGYEIGYDEELVFTVPTYPLNGETTYRIAVGTDGVGWAGNEDSIEFTTGPRNDQEEPAKDVWVPKTTYQTQEDVEILAYYSGAEWYDVEIRKAGDPEWFDYRRGNVPMMQVIWSADQEGEYTFDVIAKGFVRDENGNILKNEDGSDQEWSDLVGSKTVAVTAVGSLENAVIHDIPAHLIYGNNNGIDGYFAPVADAEFYNIQMHYCPDQGDWETLEERGFDAVEATEDDYRLQMGPEQLTRIGRYNVSVYAAAANRNASFSEVDFQVLNGSTDTISLTANGGTGEIGNWPISKDMEFTVSAPGTEAIRLWNGDRWWYVDNSSMDENGLYTFTQRFDNPGDYVLYAQTTRSTHPAWEGNDWDSFVWEEMEWSGVSNDIRINVYANGNLAAPDFELSPDTLAWGDLLTVTVDPVIRNEDGDPVEAESWYYIGVQKKETREDGSVEWPEVDFRENRPHINDENQILIPTYLLEENTDYRIYVGVDAVAWHGNDSSKEFTVGPRGQTGAPIFQVSKTECQTQENIDIVASYDGAEWIDVEIRKEGDPGWRNDFRSDRAAMLLEWSADQAGVYTLTAYAGGIRYDEEGQPQLDEDGNERTWQEVFGSHTVTVNAEAELAKAVLHGIPGAIVLNPDEPEPLDGSFESIPNAEYYEVYLSYERGENDWEELINRSFDAGDPEADYTLHLDYEQMAAREGHYQLHIYASARGYSASHTDIHFYVYLPTENSISLTAEGQTQSLTWTAQKTMDIAVEASGATAVRILNQDGNWAYVDSRSIEDDGMFHWYGGFESGSFTLMAQACYDVNDWETNNINDYNFNKNLTWLNNSNTVDVVVTSGGLADAAVFTVPESVTRGELLEVTIAEAGAADSPSRATRVYAWTQNANGEDNSTDAGKDRITDYPITVKLPTGPLDPGTYYVFVNTSAEGYDTNTVWQKVTVTEPDGQDPFIFTVEDGLIHNTGFSISAYEPNAAWLEVVLQPEEGETFTWGPYEGNHINQNNAALEEGTYSICAVAHYVDGNGTETGTRQSETVTRQVDCLGDLDAPVITAENIHEAGTDLTFTVTGLDQGDWWDVTLFDRDITVTDQEGNEGPKAIRSWNANKGLMSEFTVSSDLLTAGHNYWVHANVNRQGYRNGHADVELLVAETSTGDVWLTIEPMDAAEGETLDNWPVSKNLRFMVQAPNAEAVRIWTPEGWRYPGQQSKDEEETFTFEDTYGIPVTHTYLAQVSYTENHPDWGSDNWGNFDWNSMEWTDVSNQVQVTFYSNGELAPVDYTLVSGNTVKRGEPFVIAINSRQGRDEWYGARLLWEGGQSEYYGMDDGTNTITVMTESIEPGNYDLFIWADAFGYEGVGENVPVTVTAAGENEIVFTLEKTEVTAQEQVRWSVYAPGAVMISMEAWEEFSDGSKNYFISDYDNHEWEDHEALSGQNAFDHGTTVRMQATVTYGDGRTVQSDLKQILVSSNGSLEDPTIQAHLWQKGETLHLYIRPDSRTEWYRVYAGSDSGTYYKSPEGGDFGEKEITLYGNVLGDTDAVTVSIYQAGTGMDSNYKEICIRAVDFNGSLYLPSGLERIEEEAFAGDNSITHVSIPGGVSYIGAGAFADCRGLLTVEIPYSVTGIQAGAFMNGNITIYGYAGSEAERYARENNISFVDTIAYK